MKYLSLILPFFIIFIAIFACVKKVKFYDFDINHDKLKIPIRGIMDILKPSIFNSLCYKKLSLLGLSSNID
jgi:hypothetical protein